MVNLGDKRRVKAQLDLIKTDFGIIELFISR